MPILSNLTNVAAVNDSILTAFKTEALIANGQVNVMERLVSIREEIGAVSINMPIYGRLAVQTTPLGEGAEATPVAMSDSKVILTPQEYGVTVTKTRLASLQTGGMVDVVAAQNVGLNWGQTMDKLAINAAALSTNILTPQGTAVTALAAGDIVTRTFLNKMYNKLERASVPKIAGTGLYAAVLHPDVVNDIRESASGGSWTDIVKTSMPELALTNAVGVYCGFLIIQDTQLNVANANGVTNMVDAYDGLYLGANALGKAVSQTGRIIIKDGLDTMDRFAHVSWYEVCQYGIVDSTAIWRGVTASSLGNNAA